MANDLFSEGSPSPQPSASLQVFPCPEGEGANQPGLNAPLAEQLRPRTLVEVIGQQHLTGEGMPLAIAFASGKPHSMILWGPPGVGKTTIARLMAHAFESDFISSGPIPRRLRRNADCKSAALNPVLIPRGLPRGRSFALSAVLSGVKEIREAIERARVNRENLARRTILFVDEVHRFNKSQQDAFLPHVARKLRGRS